MHKPLTIANEDRETLQDLGRACVEIVHDTRNELNALKLYATFLFRRSEKSNWQLDERETLAKVFVGLERSATDLNMLVRYSRPIELTRLPDIDLRKVVDHLPLDPGLEQIVNGHLKDSIIAESDPGDFGGQL